MYALSSSPLPAGSASFKRNGYLQTRATSSAIASVPRLSSPEVPDVFRHFSISSQRRGVASSPTDGNSVSSVCVAKPVVAQAQVTTIGFAVQEPQEPQLASPFNSNIVPLPSQPKAPVAGVKKGLLARALSHGEEPSSSAHTPAQFFPDVDTQMLEDLQVSAWGRCLCMRGLLRDFHALGVPLVE